MNNSEFAIVLITYPDNQRKAEDFARTLVKEHLAACVNLVPKVVSFYTWKGELQQDNEFLLIVKTRRSLFDAIKERVKALHPYEVPEIIMLPIENGLQEYLNWIKESTK